MKYIAIIAATILIVTCNPVSADDWDREDTYRQLGYTALHLARWLQARDNRPTEQYLTEGPLHFVHYENRRVGRSEINREYALTLALHFAVARLLPEDERKIFQYVSIGVQGYSVLDEQRAHIGFTMPF